MGPWKGGGGGGRKGLGREKESGPAGASTTMGPAASAHNLPLPAPAARCTTISPPAASCKDHFLLTTSREALRLRFRFSGGTACWHSLVPHQYHPGHNHTCLRLCNTSINSAQRTAQELQTTQCCTTSGTRKEVLENCSVWVETSYSLKFNLLLKFRAASCSFCTPLQS